jgi:hypothetical protein
MMWQRQWLIRAGGVMVFSSLACSFVTGPRPLPHWGPTERDLEARCQGGTWAACGELGRLLMTAQGTDREHERGLVLLESACGQEDVPACTALGTEYATHFRHEQARARARSVLAWACDHRSGAACTGLGKLSPFPVDRLQLFRKGCELEDLEGCALSAEPIRPARASVPPEAPGPPARK